MSVRSYLALQLETQMEKQGETFDTFARLLGYRSRTDSPFRRLMSGRSRIDTYEAAFAALGLRIAVTVEPIKSAQDNTLQETP